MYTIHIWLHDNNSWSYDILANTDDGSCLYLDIFGICDGNNTIQMAELIPQTHEILYIYHQEHIQNLW